jgi:DNA replication protein DnaC
MRLGTKLRSALRDPDPIMTALAHKVLPMTSDTSPTWRPFPPALARPACSFCHGTGWQIVGDSRPGNWQEQSTQAPSKRVTRARRCPCARLDRLLILKERVRVPQRYEHCTFQTYQVSTASQERALEEATRFAARYPNVSRGLMFTGPTGVGKTHLAVAVLRALVERFREDVLFAEFETAIRFQLPLGPKTPIQDRAWARMKRIPLLVVDGFRMSERSEEEKLLALELVAARASGRRRTIYTCQDPADHCSRLVSQLLRGVRIVPIVGSDFRNDRERAPLF